MNYLAALNENILREMAGERLVSQAEDDLSSGKVTGRTRLDGDEILAFWVDAAREYEMHAANQKDGIGLACTCDAMDFDNLCHHTIALLLAWVRDPHSFIFEDEEEEEYSSYQPDRWISSTAFLKAFGAVTDPVDEYQVWLIQMTLQQLREIAGRWGVRIGGNRKAPIVEALAKSLARPESLAEAWKMLSDPAKTLMSLFPFCMVPGQPIHVDTIGDTARKWGLTSDEEFEQALEELVNLGLVFFPYSDMLAIPSRLPLWLPADPQFTPEYQGVNHLTERHQEEFVFSQLVTRLLLLLGSSGKAFSSRPGMEVHPLEKRFPYLRGWSYDPKDLEELAREKNPYSTFWYRSFRVPPAPPPLSDESRVELLRALKIDEDILDFALRLLQCAGILEATPGKPLTVDRQGSGKFWQSSPFERARFLFSNYSELRNWTEFDLVVRKYPSLSLYHTSSLPAGGSYSQMLDKLSMLRYYLLLQVRRQPAGRWVDFEVFVERARLLPVNKQILKVRDFWYVDVQGHRANYDKLSDWKPVYRAFAEAVLTGPLFYQGLVDLAYKGDRLAAFRLTDFGAALFNPGLPFNVTSSKAESPALSFAPGGELILDPDRAQGRLLELLNMVGEARLAAGQEIAYRLTPAGAGQAFESGWNMESILAVMEKAAGKPVPPELVAPMKKWWDNFGTVQFYQDLAIIEFGDDFILNELLAGSSLPRYLLYRFSPRLIAVRSEGVEILRGEWIKKGYTPKIAA